MGRVRPRGRRPRLDRRTWPRPTGTRGETGRSTGTARSVPVAAVDAEPGPRIEEVEPPDVDDELDGLALLGPGPRAQPGQERRLARASPLFHRLQGLLPHVVGQLLHVLGDHRRGLDL